MVHFGILYILSDGGVPKRCGARGNLPLIFPPLGGPAKVIRAAELMVPHCFGPRPPWIFVISQFHLWPSYA